jgi:integrase/recombinase XerD
VRPKAVQRYAVSLGQLTEWLDGKQLAAIDGRLVAEIIRARTAAGVTNATIKRDLVALSSVINYAVDQGWLDHNPVLARMARVKEQREPIALPRTEDIALVLERAPNMVAHLIRAAIATGARESELLAARHVDVNLKDGQLILTGKRSKRRTIDLRPFDGVGLIRALPVYAGKPLLFLAFER